MKESTMPEKRQEESQVQDTREETKVLTPPVDIFETQEGLAVVADLPGSSKESIDVRVEKDILTLKSKVTWNPPGEPLHREYELRDYFRQFQLSDHVDQEKIRAEMKHGVLIIHLPKKEESKPKQIEVQVD